MSSLPAGVEPPFLSREDGTPLKAGMTFTDEPSIMLLGTPGGSRCGTTMKMSELLVVFPRR
jgi:Xaa-Pro aminopeptidase